MSTPEGMHSSQFHEMSASSDIAAVAIQVSREIVVASIQVDLDDDVLTRFREDLLQRIHGTDSRGVILDLSALEMLDPHEFAGLRRIMTMSTIMGAECILVGLRPGVVSALIEAGTDVDGLRAAINLDAAFAMLEPEPEIQPEIYSEVPADTDMDTQASQPPDSGPALAEDG